MGLGAFAQQHEKRAATAAPPRAAHAGSDRVAAASGGGVPLFLQAKLAVGRADDPLEHEADRVADEVLRMPGSAPAPGAGADNGSEHGDGARPQAAREILAGRDRTVAPVRRVCSRCEEEETLQAKAASSDVPGVTPEVHAQIDGLRGGGKPLPLPLRDYFEPRFGYDFSTVHIHTDDRAARGAAAINARAFTRGRDIAFASGEYAPSTSTGLRLIGHELAHVVQQSPDRVATKLNIASAAAGSADLMQRQPRGMTLKEYEEWERQEQARKEQEQQAREQAEVSAIGRASGRGRRLVADNAGSTGLMIAGAEVVYRMLAKYFPFLVDSVTGVGFESAVAKVRISPHDAQRPLDQDAGFGIEFGPAFLKAGTPEQQAMLEYALRQLPSVAGAPSHAEALTEAAGIVATVQFGSTTGSVGGQRDPDDAYDASAWDEISKKTIRARIEPWRAMKRLVDKAAAPVPKAGGGTTYWRFDCFDAVVFAQVYARWRVMTRYNFDYFYFPLELGFLSRPKETEWGPAVQSEKPGGERFTEGKERPVAPGSSQFFVPRTAVRESWTELLRTAPVGTQIIWSNADAASRCKQAKQLNQPEPAFCESFQNENAAKLGPDLYMAHPFGVRTQKEIETALANAVRDTLPRPPELEQYIRQFIYISALRRPK